MFKPQIRQTSDGYYIVAKDIYMRIANENFSSNTELVSIPVFKSDDVYSRTVEDFEQRLLSNRILGEVPHMSKLDNEYPYAVIWEENDDERFLYYEIKGHIHSFKSVKYEVDGTDIKKYQLNKEWEEKQYQFESGDIIFVPYTLIKDEKINELSKMPIYKEAIDNTKSNFDTEKNSEFSPKEINSEDSITINKKNLYTNNEIKKIDTYHHTDFISADTDEGKLLHRFREAAYKENLYYDDKDLINFHVAMKTGSLVILAGQSGTGKSKLVRCYSKALQMKKSQTNFISVRPFWQDDSDLLGYGDTINSIYRPGDSGLIDTLGEAYENQDQMYIVCFDEMNLARVEHYFSQFLSVLEMDSEYREIRLYDKSLEHRFYNSDKYKPTISIGNNVLFVGTVNLDESTHNFSDKVLDRSNVIALNVLPFTDYLNRQNLIFSEVSKTPTEGVSAKTYKNFRIDEQTLSLTHEEVEFLWEIHQSLSKINKNLGVGWRILRQIDKYLKNIPNNNIYTRNEAFDHQLVQRIFTKIRGSEEQLNEILGEYRNEEIVNSSFIKLMDKYPTISKFESSRKIIEQKTRELVQNGYTL